MLKSLYSGVSAIQAHQVKLDVIGNNIANVNTTGYKRSDVTFEELLNQTISGASSPSSKLGGKNPIQVGLGVKVGSITTQFTQGNLQYTGSNTDIAIEGNGFFIVADGSTKYYTRAGSFALDSSGNLVHSSTGMILQGWLADDNGNINVNTPITSINIPIGKTIPAKETSIIKFEQNLDSRLNGTLSYIPSSFTITSSTSDKAQISISIKPAGGFNRWEYSIDALGVEGSTVSSITNKTGIIELDENGNVVSTGSDIIINFNSGSSVTIKPPALSSLNGGKFEIQSPAISDAEAKGVYSKPFDFENTIQIYDKLGGMHNIKLVFSKIADNTWRWRALSLDDGITVSGSGVLEYDANTGNFSSVTNNKITINYGSGMGFSEISIDFSKTTQFSSPSSILATSQNGYSSGALQNFSIDAFGCVNGIFSNGVIMKIGQIAIANFANPSGLTKAQGSLFSQSNNSGIPYIGAAATDGRGKLISGNLETSNVDLSKEFTDLITTQRGYQANARLISTSDEILNELINIKR